MNLSSACASRRGVPGVPVMGCSTQQVLPEGYLPFIENSGSTSLVPTKGCGLSLDLT